MSDDRLSAALEEIRERHALTQELCGDGSVFINRLHRSATDVPRLLAAVEAVLARHRKQATPMRSWDLDLRCPAHPPSQAFPSFEVIRNCPDCSYRDREVCANSHCHEDWPCPEVLAITSALLPEETPAATVPEPAPASLAAEIAEDQAGVGGSMNPTPDCGGERKPPGATEVWWCDAHREFHGDREEGGHG